MDDWIGYLVANYPGKTVPSPPTNTECKPLASKSLIVEQKRAAAIAPAETLLVAHAPVPDTHVHSLGIAFCRRIAIVECAAQLVERWHGEEFCGFAVGVCDAGDAAVVAGVVGEADDGLEGGGVVALAGEVGAWGWGEDDLG